MTFDPASLFAQGQAGAWFDVSDASTLFQDIAGTVAVTAPGQAVARVNDKSGNGQHLTQSTAAKCPTYAVDGTGRFYLDFDGVDDFLKSAITISLPFDRVSAIQQVAWTIGRRIFAIGTGTMLNQRTKAPELNITDGITDVVKVGGLEVGTNGVVTERHVAGASRVAVNNGAYVTGDAGSNAPSGSLSVGADPAGNVLSKIRLYAMLMRAGPLSNSEIGDLRLWMADRAGVTFQTRRSSRHSCWL